ncbi:MAG TPA: hypothetical protein V6C86_04445 [Oculatellaceae cyanobacterium]
MVRKRRPRGATMGMVAAVTLVFVLLGVFVIFLVKLLGGGEQMQRSADSGNLSLTRAELDQFSFPIPSTGNELQFNGASDHTAGGNGVVNVRNINSVMGQALLVNMNAFYMQQQGQDNGAMTHANQTSNAANSIASSLASVMGNATNTFNSYNTTSANMPTQEFGAGNSTAAGAPQFSYLDRGTASNVYISPQEMPDYNWTTGVSSMYNNNIAPYTTTVSSALDAGKNNYMIGYTNGITPDKTLPNTYFVPLRPGARPHLVSRQLFQTNNKPSSGSPTFNWSTPVANGVSQAATKQDTEHGFAQFAAYGQIEPISAQGTPVAIRHGFIRLMNGSPSPASGYAAGNSQDVFVFTMNDPQFFPTDKNGKAMPYFVGQNSLPSNMNPAQYIQNIVDANSNGKTPDCSALSVGYAVNGDTLGQGGVSSQNCANIAGNPGTNPSYQTAILNNTNLSDASSQGNKMFASLPLSDPLGYSARPYIEQAYGLQPAQATGSNGQSVSVADQINLALLSARAQGQNFTAAAGQYNSGIAYVPSRSNSLSSPNFKIAAQPEQALITSTAGTSSQKEGITAGGPVWQFLTQRMYEIDPNFPSYTGMVTINKQQVPNVDAILSQAQIPMAGEAIIYFSTSAKNAQGQPGAIVMREKSAALADAPWLASFINQSVDGRKPTNPSEVSTFKLISQGGTGGDGPSGMIDVDGDWGFPHPYDGAPDISITNWFAITPCSGFNNLLGEINMGATNTNGGGTCPATGGAYTVNVSPSGADTITVPAQGGCNGTATATSPC